MRVDSPGLDVGDGLLDHLADPADALIRLFGGFAQFAVGGLLVRGDHSLADVSLVGDPSGGVQAVEQSGRRLVRPRRAWSRGRGRRPTRVCRWAGPGSGRSCRSSHACPTTIRGERANSSRGRGCRPARQSQPSGTSSAVSSLSFRARTIAPVMTPDGPRDSGLGHTQLLADHRLHNVVTHVDQRRPQRPPQPHSADTPRHPPRADG